MTALSGAKHSTCRSFTPSSVKEKTVRTLQRFSTSWALDTVVISTSGMIPDKDSSFSGSCSATLRTLPIMQGGGFASSDD
jgi:hypothetical protein